MFVRHLRPFLLTSLGHVSCVMLTINFSAPIVRTVLTAHFAATAGTAKKASSVPT